MVDYPVPASGLGQQEKAHPEHAVRGPRTRTAAGTQSSHARSVTQRKGANNRETPRGRHVCVRAQLRQKRRAADAAAVGLLRERERRSVLRERERAAAAEAAAAEGDGGGAGHGDGDHEEDDDEVLE